MYRLHAINSDRQTRLLNVFGQIAMFWEIKKKAFVLYIIDIGFYDRNGECLLRGAH
jgi:hypothetical protein